jgi:hypothetical protein
LLISFALNGLSPFLDVWIKGLPSMPTKASRGCFMSRELERQDKEEMNFHPSGLKDRLPWPSPKALES